MYHIFIVFEAKHLEVLWIIPIFAIPILSKLKMIMKKLLTTLLLFCAMTTVMAQQYTYGGKKYDYKVAFPMLEYRVHVVNSQGADVSKKSPFTIYLSRKGYGIAIWGQHKETFNFTSDQNRMIEDEFGFGDDIALIGNRFWIHSGGIGFYFDYKTNGKAYRIISVLNSSHETQKATLRNIYSLVKDHIFMSDAAQSHSSTATKPNDPGEKQTGKDGLVWYKKTEGNKVGAIEEQGNVIIPIQYDDVNYIGGSGGSLDMAHYFKVKKGNYEGAYTRKGRCVISTDKGFDGVVLTYAGHARKMGWTVTKDGIWGLLDAKGNVVIPYVDKSKYLLDHWSLSDVGVDDGCGAYINRKITTWDSEDFEGVYDLNGECVIEPNYSMVLVFENKIKTKDLSGNENTLYITVGQNTRFDYNPYDGLLY